MPHLLPAVTVAFMLLCPCLVASRIFSPEA